MKVYSSAEFTDLLQ